MPNQASRKLAVSPKDARDMTQQSNFDSTFTLVCTIAVFKADLPLVEP